MVKISSASPVGPVDTEKLGIWAQETELDFDKGVITSEGNYRVFLASYQNSKLAQVTKQKYQSMGYPAETTLTTKSGQTWTRIAVNSFASREDAEYFIANADRRFGIDDAWMNENSSP